MKAAARIVLCGPFLACLLSAATMPASGQSTEPSAPTPRAIQHDSFESFQLFIDRNIFNSDRKASDIDRNRNGDEAAEEAEIKEATPPLVIQPDPKQICLVGILIDGATDVAFFNTTESASNTVVKKGSSILGLTLSEILVSEVKILCATEALTLPVGSTLSSHKEGQWSLSNEPFKPRGSSGASPPMPGFPAPPMPSTPGAFPSPPMPPGPDAVSASAPAPPADANASSETNDILKRMMERRRKESGQ